MISDVVFLAAASTTVVVIGTARLAVGAVAVALGFALRASHAVDRRLQKASAVCDDFFSYCYEEESAEVFTEEE
jgi:NAD/NADP transhydrogenase alpha subunit